MKTGWRAALREHWLAGVECDPVTETDRALCACSQVDLGRQASVGAAVETWIAHVGVIADTEARG